MEAKSTTVRPTFKIVVFIALFVELLTVTILWKQHAHTLFSSNYLSILSGLIIVFAWIVFALICVVNSLRARTSRATLKPS